MASQGLADVSLTLRLSKHTEAKLNERAAATGKPLADYVSTLVESVVATPRTLTELSGAVYKRFLESGVTDDELADEIEEAKHQLRAQRRVDEGS